MKQSYTTNPPVFLEWIDSAGRGGKWEEIDAESDISNELAIIHTVGWVLNETKDVITISSQISDETDDVVGEVYGVISIPKVAIRKRYLLTELQTK